MPGSFAPQWLRLPEGHPAGTAVAWAGESAPLEAGGGGHASGSHSPELPRSVHKVHKHIRFCSRPSPGWCRGAGVCLSPDLAGKLPLASPGP